MAAPAQTSKGMVLSSWKEIAAYLSKGVRTVQRWERLMGLPVHRPEGCEKGVVLAYAAELDAWVHRGRAAGQDAFLSSSSNGIMGVQQAPTDGAELRQTCQNLRSAHRELVVLLRANLSTTMRFVEYGRERRRRTSSSSSANPSANRAAL